MKLTARTLKNCFNAYLTAFILTAVLSSFSAAKEKVVRIAVAVPLTGDMGTEGQGLKRAVELAVEEANAAKRFDFQLKVAPFDDRADPKEAVNVANLIVSDPRIVAVIGHYNSGCAIPAAKVYARSKVPMISPAATNPEVTRQQLSPDWTGPKIVFRVVPTDDVQGTYAATYVFKKLKKKSISILHDKTPYGQGLAEEFKRTFAAQGGAIASEDGISVGDKDFKALLTRIKASGSQGVYFGGLYTEAGLIVKQMRELGITSIFVTGDGAKTPSLFDVAGESADGAYASIVGVPVELLPSAKDFMTRYQRRWNGTGQEIKPFDHFGYEAAQILLSALEKAGTDKVKLTEAIRATKYKGILGTTVFDEKGDTKNKIITMTKARFSDRSFPAVE